MSRVLGGFAPLIRRVSGSRPLSMRVWYTLQRLGRRPDALVPRARSAPGSQLPDPVLAEALHDVELGTWSLGARSIAFVMSSLAEERPAVIIEFGSGASTVCIARLAAQMDPSPTVISIEQDEEQVARTRSLLKRLPPSDLNIHLIHAPLVRAEHPGRQTSRYAIPKGALEHALGGSPVGMVLVDGPAAEDGARYETIPLVRHHLTPGALVLLDDALRDGELEVARRWARDCQLDVKGIVAIDHGLLVARVRAG